MSFKRNKKLIDHAQQQLENFKIKPVSNFNQAVKLENSIIDSMKPIKKILNTIKNDKNTKESHKPALIKDSTRISKEFTAILDSCSDLILKNLNQKYNLDLTIDTIKLNHLDFYCNNGTRKTVYEKYIQAMFNDVLENHLPEHPKDLYENARKLNRTIVIHTGPTNSGKTFKALEALKTKRNGIYLSPLRLLALEVFEKLNIERVECNLITGEEEIILRNATHTSCTVEKSNIEKEYNIAVIDECQMIADPSRGAAWTRAILGLCAKELHLCCSPNALELLLAILKDCNDNITIIEHKRDIPLLVEKNKFRFPNNIQKGDAFIVFSRASVLKVAAFLNSEGIKSSIIYGNLPPETRRKQVELFNEGKTDVVVATDAIGMGLNLPIRRIIFLENQKFDGQTTRYLTSSEIKQISGRAGRKGIYDEGYVNSIHGKSLIQTSLEEMDEPIQYAYIFPDEELILNYFQMGTLKERLLTWVNYNFEYAYFKKADISELIELLTDLEKKKETSKEILFKKYKLILTPFNKRNEKIFEYWYRCAFDILDDKKKALDKPAKASDELVSLENYYQMLAVYYYLCKTFKMNFDEKWVEAERENTSDKIHEYLIKNIKNHVNRCRVCGKKLSWNSFYSICEQCYAEKYVFSYSDYL